MDKEVRVCTRVAQETKHRLKILCAQLQVPMEDWIAGLIHEALQKAIMVARADLKLPPEELAAMMRGGATIVGQLPPPEHQTGPAGRLAHNPVTSEPEPMVNQVVVDEGISAADLFASVGLDTENRCCAGATRSTVPAKVLAELGSTFAAFRVTASGEEEIST